MKSIKSIANLGLCALVVVSLSACGGKDSKFLQSVNVSVTERDQKSFVQLSSTFDLGNVSLAEMAVSVIDPKTQQEAGTINFYNLANGQGKITLDVNASLLLHADADLGLTLPNGRAIPVALNAKHGDVMGIQVLEHSRIYLGGDLKTQVYAGVALGIKGLDQVMSQIQAPANVFFMVNPSAQLMGVGGIYGSPNADQNGVAVFGKYTANPTPQLTSQSVNTSSDYEFDQLNRKTQKRIMNYFYGKKRVLNFH